MSSSRIFKQDAAFTPTPLVQHDLTITPDPCIEEIVPEVAEPEQESTFNESPAEVVEEPGEEIPEEQPEPTVDIQALQEEAYAQGVNDTTSRLEAELLPAVEAFHQACQKIDNQRHALLDTCRGEIINTVIALSKKVIGDELLTKRDVIANTLEKALHQAIRSDEFIVTIHPDDLTIVEERKAELISEIRGLERLVLKTDINVSRGGCLLESNTCSIDATIESQLKSAEDFLEEHTELPSLNTDESGNEVMLPE